MFVYERIVRCMRATARILLRLTAVLGNLRDARLDGCQVLQQFELCRNVVKRVVRVRLARLRKTAVLAEALYLHSVRVDEHQRLHAVVLCAPEALVRRAHGLRRADKQAGRVCAKIVKVDAFHSFGPVRRKLLTKHRPDFSRCVRPFP